MVSMVFYGISLNAVNFSVNPFLYMALGGVMEIPAYTLTVPIVEYWGRRIPSAAFYFVAGASILALAVVPAGREGGEEGGGGRVRGGEGERGRGRGREEKEEEGKVKVKDLGEKRRKRRRKDGRVEEGREGKEGGKSAEGRKGRMSPEERGKEC